MGEGVPCPKDRKFRSSSDCSELFKAKPRSTWCHEVMLLPALWWNLFRDTVSGVSPFCVSHRADAGRQAGWTFSGSYNPDT